MKQLILCAFLLAACDDPPTLSEAPTKEQVVKYAQDKIGEGRTLLWYIPYKPEVQQQGATTQPVRSYVAYEHHGLCFITDLQAHSSYLISCDNAAPKGAVKP